MAETVLPGVSIEVRAEGLIIPLGVTVGNLGVVGTASKGPINTPVILGSFSEAQEVFGNSNAFTGDAKKDLTLVRALELAFNFGATTAIAVRVAYPESGADAAKKPKAATYKLQSAGGDNTLLTAKTPGTWGNGLEINVTDAEEGAFIENEIHDGAAGDISLKHPAIVPSARNRITVFTFSSGLTKALKVRYDGDGGGPLKAGEVEIEKSSGKLSFFAGEKPTDASDKVTASYVVHKDNSVKVTLRLGRAEEVYTVVSGEDLVDDINKLPSAWVDATGGANKGQVPTKSASKDEFAAFGTGTNQAGSDGIEDASYQDGLDVLLDQDAHIIVAAGQDNSFGDELAAHCQQASSDLLKRDRIAVVGSKRNASFPDLQGHTLNSDRVIFVAPGIKVNDRATSQEVTLPGAYAAAAVAGLIAGFEPHVSPTNKVLNVGGLETIFTTPQLRSLVQNRVLALEKRDGFRIVKGITTSTDTAWHQITTRRIVDYAKAGVRSAANPFIGKLNNDRVRGALRTSINSFLADMIDSEMLVSYELDVSATRQQEIRGIVQVTMVLRPTFSIDFIRVTIFLE